MRDNEQRNENRDTVAEVVAMVRRAAQYYEGEAEKSEGPLRKSFELSATSYREIANLVEAAYKRERAKVEADALAVGGVVEAERHRPGNVAAMREALVNLDKWLFIGVDCYVHGQPDKTVEIERTIKSALSEPARNCDLFKDAQTAWRAWIEDADNWDEFGSPKLELPEWLFASAKKKGENDGIK